MKLYVRSLLDTAREAYHIARCLLSDKPCCDRMAYDAAVRDALLIANGPDVTAADFHLWEKELTR